MGILGGLFGGIYLASSGGSKKQVQTPPINAGSKDEEKFIQYVFFLSLAVGRFGPSLIDLFDSSFKFSEILI